MIVSLEVADPGSLQMINYTRVGEAKNIFLLRRPWRKEGRQS